MFFNNKTLIISERTNGDSVTQKKSPVILPEGAPLTLNCIYQTSYPVFPVLICPISQKLSTPPEEFSGKPEDRTPRFSESCQG
jgi:hypothetical protein